MKHRQATRRWATRVIAAGVGALWLSVTAPALAQQAATSEQRPARVYAGASALFTSQPGTSLGSQSGDTPLEGGGLAFSALFGAGGRLSVEGHLTRGTELQGAVGFHVSGGTASYDSTFRDTLVSAFVRYRGSPRPRVLVEPVGGVTLAFGRGTVTNSFVLDGASSPQYSFDSDLRRRSLGFGGGLDVLVPVGRRAAVGGLFRLHRLVWNDETNFESANLGLGRWIWQAGAGVRVDLAAHSRRGVTPQAAAAQDDGRPRGYVGGFAGLFAQPVGEVDGHYLTEGVGGNGFGFGGTAGAFFASRWSAAAEVAIGPEFETQSFFAGRIRYDTRYRDTLISALLRWHPGRPGTAAVAVEPVVGLTVAGGHAPRTATWIARFNSDDEEPTDATISRVSFGPVGGADFLAPAGKVSFVASVRVHLLDRNDTRDDQPPELGIGRFVYTFAGGLRVTF